MTAGLLAGAILALALPARAGEVYAWRTEDGGYAFAGDAKSVPPRYRDRAEVRRTGRIQDYGRFTAEDDAAADRYAERLAARLERLREQNRQSAKQGGAGENDRSAPDYVTIRSGSSDGGGVDVSTPARGSGPPLETETIFVKRKDSDVVQPVRITRRGGEIVSISKPRNSQWNISDFEDEDKLLQELRD